MTLLISSAKKTDRRFGWVNCDLGDIEDESPLPSINIRAGGTGIVFGSFFYL